MASPKVLSLDNKSKKKRFCFVLFSLIRTFAVEKYEKGILVSLCSLVDCGYLG